MFVQLEGVVFSAGVEVTDWLDIVTMLKDRYCQSHKDTACCVRVEERGSVGSCVCCMYSGGRAAPSSLTCKALKGTHHSLCFNLAFYI